MIYTIRKARIVTQQLKRFTSGYAHHIAGQYANIDFWIKEVLDAQKVIDEYAIRFNNMAFAQENWVSLHDTKVYDLCSICGGKCEFSDGTPSPPYSTSKKELKNIRKELVNATYYFLARCYRVGLLDDDEIKAKCDLIGTSIDPNDLER